LPPSEVLRVMRRLANRFYYHVETLLIRGPIYQLMLVAMVILGLSLSGGVMVHLTNPDAYSNTLEAVWWAFLRLTDPGYLGDDRGFFPRLVSTLLTLAGYVVFLGALVALMTTWLDRTLSYLASGRSQIFEEGHVLIIGWNDRLHALVEEIVHTAQHFHDRESKRAIVILCEDYKPSMHHELMQKIDPEVRHQCRVLIRSGNPLEIESLERVDFAYARSIILVSRAGSERSARSLSDVTLAKVLMSMKAHSPGLTNPPNVVVEVANPGNKLLVESVGWHRQTEAVVADDIMGRLFCQAVRFPGISNVYHRLLTDTFGHSINLRKASDIGMSGKPLRESVSLLRSGTPIGLLKAGGEQVHLQLLNLDQDLEPDDLVVVISTKSPRSTVMPTAEAPDIELPPLDHKMVKRHILVNGWSTDLYTFLAELSANAEEECHVTLLWENPRPTERKRLEQLQNAQANLTLKFGLSALLDDTELKRAQIEQFDKILLLADQTQERLVADAENVLRYVLLDRFVRARGLKIDLVVELNDEDNRPLLTGMEPDVLMTGEILSHLLAQVSTYRSLMWIYEELFTKGGAELRLRPMTDLTEQPTTFAVCQAACLKADAVALGYYRGCEAVFNPDPTTQLAASDRLILIEMEER
jgi:Trk K+ transport system NAD-binding subunit